MKQIRKFAALILAFSVLFSLAVPTFAASSVQSEVQGSAAYMVSAVKAPEVGSIGGEWAIIGLARSGYAVPANYYEDYYARVEKYVKNCSGVLHERKYTEYSRVILALTAIGRDPSKVAGYNLLTPLGDFEKTIWQGMNGPIWALIALDSGNYDIQLRGFMKTQRLFLRKQCHRQWNILRVNRFLRLRRNRLLLQILRNPKCGSKHRMRKRQRLHLGIQFRGFAKTQRLLLRKL